MIGVSRAGRRPQAAVPPQGSTMAPGRQRYHRRDDEEVPHPGKHPLLYLIGASASTGCISRTINLENDGGTGTFGNRDGSLVNRQTGTY